MAYTVTDTEVRTLNWEDTEGTAEAVLDINDENNPALTSLKIYDNNGQVIFFPGLSMEQLIFISDVLNDTIANTIYYPEEAP